MKNSIFARCFWALEEREGGSEEEREEGRNRVSLRGRRVKRRKEIFKKPCCKNKLRLHAFLSDSDQHILWIP